MTPFSTLHILPLYTAEFMKRARCSPIVGLLRVCFARRVTSANYLLGKPVGNTTKHEQRSYSEGLKLPFYAEVELLRTITT